MSIEDRLSALFEVPKLIHTYEPGVRNIFCLEGKAVIMCLLRLEFWFLLSMQVIITVYYHRLLGFETQNGMPMAAGWPKASSNLLIIPGGLLSFLVVFFLNAAYTRYHTQYMRCKKLADALARLRLAFRVHFADEAFAGAREVRHNLLKLLGAAHVIAYAALPQNRKVSVHLWAFHYILEKGLLTKPQVEKLRPLMAMEDGRLLMMEVFQWINCAFWAHKGRGESSFESKGMLQMSGKIFEARQHMEYNFAMAHAPIPFMWFKMLSSYVTIYLFVLAYVSAFTTSKYYSTSSYFLILLAFISLRELGCVMSDPFGQDGVDIPVFSLVFEFDKETRVLADTKPLGHSTLQRMRLADEEYLAQKLPGKS